MQTMLAKLVCEIVQSQPDGLKHVEVVVAVLRSGYRHQGDQPISAAVYETLKNLVVSGVISRIQDDLMERRYKKSGQSPIVTMIAPMRRLVIESQ